ncbi:MAG: outer membrane protein assembly factor BamE [Candidatus Reddybacter sp.]
MPSRFLLALVIVTAALLNGCSYLKYPDMHKVTVQQGNIVNQEMVDQLRPSMTRSQVRYILGTPLLMDTFDQDRWDYYYSIKRPGQKEVREKITVFFDGNTLTHFSGDYLPSSLKTPETDGAKEKDSAEALPSAAELEASAPTPTQ